MCSELLTERNWAIVMGGFEDGALTLAGLRACEDCALPSVLPPNITESVNLVTVCARKSIMMTYFGLEFPKQAD